VGPSSVTYGARRRRDVVCIAMASRIAEIVPIAEESSSSISQGGSPCSYWYLAERESDVTAVMQTTTGINRTAAAGMIAARTIMSCSTSCPGVGYDGGSEGTHRRDSGGESALG
jgi:hypothetical protein